MTLVTLHNGLIDHAKDCVFRQKMRSDASVRRAVSGAYYAVFHMIVTAAVSEKFEAVVDTDYAMNAFGRKADHIKIFKLSDAVVCHDVSHPQISSMFAKKASADVVAVSMAFMDLYDLRIEADYDRTNRFRMKDALKAMALADDAMLRWSSARSGTDETFAMFLSSVVAIVAAAKPRANKIPRKSRNP